MLTNNNEEILARGNISLEDAASILQSVPARIGEIYRIALNINNKEGWPRVLELKKRFEKNLKWKVVRNTVTSYGVFFDVEIIQNPFPLALVILAISGIATALMIYMSVREVRKIYTPAPGEAIIGEIKETYDPSTGLLVEKITAVPSAAADQSKTLPVLLILGAGVVLLGSFFLIKKTIL